VNNGPSNRVAMLTAPFSPDRVKNARWRAWMQAVEDPRETRCYSSVTIMSALGPPSVMSRRVVYKTPWFELRAKEGVGFDQPYYVIETTDYATIVPISPDGMVLFVRQYRPALEAFTLELPSGHVDIGEQPVDAVRRELREETGFEALELTSLGSLAPDTGRMGNQLWAFVAKAKRVAAPEIGLELELRPIAEVARMVREAELRHALDVAVLTKAALAGHLPLFGIP
jgi:ADP-ribose pyrophosphatase